MRVVSGEAGGRKLAAPTGANTRPTSDRVREATFNALGSLDAVVDARVLDLFAGSGAMGIEALSRGAAAATFVERDRNACGVIERNLATTGLSDRATVVAADALAWLVEPRGTFDLAVCDPPYAFDGWDALLRALPATLAVLESGREVHAGEDWQVVRVKRYGTTVVHIIRRTHTAAPSTEVAK